MGQTRLSLHTADTPKQVIMQALYVVPLLVAAASAAPQVFLGGHSPLVHSVATPSVVAHPVAHAIAHPVAVAGADPLAEVSPYNYNYAVADDYSGSNFQAAESSDGLGNTQGSYSVALPDGRTQTVNYNTNDVDGYVADVAYDGVPQYPVAAPVAVAHPVAHAVAHPIAHTVAHPTVSLAHPAVSI